MYARSWWFRSRSHAAELTAGYYNTATHDGYAPIVELCARHKAALTLTCVEMCDGQHPAPAMCGPEGLLKQLRGLAARMQVQLNGENALPIFIPTGVDTVALDRIVFNTRAWYGPATSVLWAPAHFKLLPQQQKQQQQQQQHGSGGGGKGGLVACSGGSGGGGGAVVAHHCHSSGGLMLQLPGSAPSSALPSPSGAMLHAQQGAGASGRSLSEAGRMLGLGRPGDKHGVAATGLRADSYADITEPLPAMSSFTFLRLSPQLLHPAHQTTWLRFICRMQQGGYAAY